MVGVLFIIIGLCVIIIAVLLLGKYQKNEPVADMIFINSTIDMLKNQIESWKADFARQGIELQKIKNENLLLADLNARQVELIRQLESEVESKQRMIDKQTADLSNQKCTKCDIEKLNRKVVDFEQIVKAKNPFDYVAHLRAHALEHIHEYCDVHAQKLAELFKYQYKLEYLLSIYPELREYNEDEAYINYMQEEEKRCNIKNWLSDEEYNHLTEVGREQLAVDRYINEEKYKWTSWEKGRNYEIFCSYILYNEGYDIIQEGLNKKLEDKGRDIIATSKNSDKILVVQCKNWSTPVRENVVFQLFGSYAQWLFVNNRKLFDPDVEPWLYVTGPVSPVAQDCANMLNIHIRHLALKQFPAIKCNVNHNTGQKIYHLPFDRQYDLVKINAKGKGYKFKIAEALKEGFRRAYNH